MPPFPATLSIAPPIAFPRDPFAPALTLHARILDDCLPTLLELTLDHDHADGHLGNCDSLAGHITLLPDGDIDIVVLDRLVESSEVALQRGVQLALRKRPVDLHLYVVVVARDTVSLNLVRAVPVPGAEGAAAHSFEVAARDLVVEPLAQQHRPCGDWTVTRWTPPKGEAHWSWVRTPREPSTPEEAVDRLLALYQPAVDVALASLGALDERMELSAILWSTARGETVTAFSRESGALHVAAKCAPGIEHLLDTETHAGVIPVFVGIPGHAGLRWLDWRDDRSDPHGAPPFTEEKQSFLPPEALVETEGNDDAAPANAPEPVAPAPEPTPRSMLSLAETLDRISLEAYWIEMEEIVAMTDAELNEGIAAAGFDVAAERSDPWTLREAVVAEMLGPED